MHNVELEKLRRQVAAQTDAINGLKAEVVTLREAVGDKIELAAIAESIARGEVAIAAVATTLGEIKEAVETMASDKAAMKAATDQLNAMTAEKEKLVAANK